jgi:hypothetical protein
MELSPSSVAGSHADTQELPNILCNPKVHYRVHKCHPVVPIMINAFHTTPSYFSTTHFNIVHPPTSRSSQWSLSFLLSHKYHICIPLPPHSCYMFCKAHPPSLDHSNYTVKHVLNGISRVQNIFPLKPDFRLIKVSRSRLHSGGGGGGWSPNGAHSARRPLTGLLYLPRVYYNN